MIIAGRNRGRIHATSATLEPTGPSALQAVSSRAATPALQPGGSHAQPESSHVSASAGRAPAILERLRGRLPTKTTLRAALLGFDTQRVAPLLLLALALSAFVPGAHLELHTASDQVAVETSATLISVIAAILFFNRFWRHLRLRNLLLSGGLVVIAASNLGAGLLLAGNLVLAGHSAAWIVVGGRLAGWVLIASSAVVPDRYLRRPTRAAIRTILLCAGAMVALATPILVLTAQATTYQRLHSGPLGNQTAMLVGEILLALLTGVAAVAFRREAGHEGSLPARLLALACAFAAASALAACAMPSFYTSRVGVSDILRLGWLAALFACVCAEWSLDERYAPEHAVAHERRRLAADVHDLIMQDLSLALANARTLVDDPARGVQASTVVLAGERALAGARNVVSALAEQDSQPIIETVEASVRTAARNTPLTFRGGEVPLAARPDEHTRNTLVHIAREAVTNAVKHARPSAIEVVLERSDEWHLAVHDDGRGFDVSGNREGFGLISMRRQAEALGGTLRVRSTDTGGTTVEVSLP
jgi:signal transduction histidine kinase